MKNLYKAILLTLSLLLFSIYTQAQRRVVSIHPFVGDTVTYQEAIDLYLFQETSARQFDYVLALEDGGRYSLNFHGDSIHSVEIDSIELNNYHEHIEKLYQYALTQSQEKHINLGNDSIQLNESVDLHLMTADQKKRMVKDARRYHHQKVVADEMGLMGSEREDYISTSGVFVWGGKKKKKK